MRHRIKQDVQKCMRGLAAVLTFIAAIFITSGCDLNDTTSTGTKTVNSLRVKFLNESNSQYAINNIQLAPMGPVVAENTEPLSPWSGNILPEGTIIEPGEFTFFDLSIPNGHWSRYRIGIVTGSDSELMLHEQQNQDPNSGASITHWGSHDRTVSVTVVYDNGSGFYYIRGYTDGAGID